MEIFSLSVVPVLQNRVYLEKSDAIRAPTGSLMIEYCEESRIGVNAAFDPELIAYDENYNNDVPSAVFVDYLHHVARSLAERHNLDRAGASVVEIGCGDGKFLQILSRICPRLELIGIDPSYTGPATLADGRIRVINEQLRSEHLPEKVSLMICRHTLEHIWGPDGFLRMISDNTPTGVAVYFEVPSLEWTLSSGAFWDMCYEHCNYFTEPGLKQMINVSGFRNCSVESTFDGQYLGAHAVTLRDSQENRPAEKIDSAWAPTSLTAIYDQVIDNVEQLSRGRDVAVWGMATKGVMLALGLQQRQVSITAWVDVNQAKQGCYVPVTGFRIDAPDILENRDVDILCMNPNYMTEVADEARRLSVSGTVYSPDLRISLAI